MTPTNPTAWGSSPRLSLPLWTERYASPPAPMTGAEMRARGWDAVDVVLVRIAAAISSRFGVSSPPCLRKAVGMAPGEYVDPLTGEHGNNVDIYYKDGSVAITHAGDKTRTIAAYGKVDKKLKNPSQWIQQLMRIGPESLKLIQKKPNTTLHAPGTSLSSRMGEFPYG
jgi:hypothetical protein